MPDMVAHWQASLEASLTEDRELHDQLRAPEGAVENFDMLTPDAQQVAQVLANYLRWPGLGAIPRSFGMSY